MVSDELTVTPFGMMLVSSRAEDHVVCPHCGATIVLAEIQAEPGILPLACPSCSSKSLLVRLVHVMHRAVRLPRELLFPADGAGDAERSTATAMAERTIETPMWVFTAPVSKGAIVLLAMLWKRAEKAGSLAIEFSIAQLSRQLLSGRAVVRRWVGELANAGALREVASEHLQRRRWELQSAAPGTEVDDAGR